MIIITGVSGGIGSIVTNSLSKKGNIIGLYNRNKPDNKNKNITHVKVDLRDENQIIEFVNSYRKKLSKITLIHFAAIKNDELAININSSDWQNIFDVNVKGAFLLTKHILRIMMMEGWGRIIFISSKGSEAGDVGTTSYSSSKMALMGISRTLSKEHALFGITSNVISLGAFDAGLYTELSEKVKNQILAKIPSKKVGSVDNITNAINFIIDSDYINGSIVTIDGGV
ncbi:SDR family oxidoreductase [Candidatus Thioglobus sp.]|nr:SDR family oxidoreductase [Candidatus Thioglobus sp.]